MKDKIRNSILKFSAMDANATEDRKPSHLNSIRRNNFWQDVSVKRGPNKREMRMVGEYVSELLA